MGGRQHGTWRRMPLPGNRCYLTKWSHVAGSFLEPWEWCMRSRFSLESNSRGGHLAVRCTPCARPGVAPIEFSPRGIWKLHGTPPLWRPCRSRSHAPCRHSWLGTPACLDRSGSAPLAAAPPSTCSSHHNSPSWLHSRKGLGRGASCADARKRLPWRAHWPLHRLPDCRSAPWCLHACGTIPRYRRPWGCWSSTPGGHVVSFSAVSCWVAPCVECSISSASWDPYNGLALEME